MQAIILSRYGTPNDLELAERDKPTPGAGQVLVRVHASAINDWDWALVRGKPYVYRLLFGLGRPKVNVLGAEMAGTVEAVGDGAVAFAPGDRVYGDLSEVGFGGFAEYVCVSETALGKMPAAMTFEHAAALPHAAMLALQGLVDVGAIQKGEKVLINGAGGGVGTLGLQIAKQYDAEVTGVDSGLKLDMMRKLGFDHVIDYQREDFTRSGRRYDLILDTKTTRSPFSYTRALNAGGRYVTVGGDVYRLLQVACLGPVVRLLTSKAVRIVALKANKDLQYVNDLFETKGIEVVIDGPYPLSDVPLALQHFGEGSHLGKVVIQVGQ